MSEYKSIITDITIKDVTIDAPSLSVAIEVLEDRECAVHVASESLKLTNARNERSVYIGDLFDEIEKKIVFSSVIEEITSRTILNNIINIMKHANVLMLIFNLKCYWVTLCTFIKNQNHSELLSFLYDAYMNDNNKARISRGDFIQQMMK